MGARRGAGARTRLTSGAKASASQEGLTSWAQRQRRGGGGRERGGWIQIRGLGLDLLGLSLNHPISDELSRSNGQGRSWARWRRSVPRRELAGDEGAGHAGALEARGLAWAQSGWSSELSHGLHAGAEAPESVDHGEAG
jgi:hypothetical protein